MRRVLALVEGIDDASVRLRVRPLLAPLLAKGITVGIEAVAPSGLARWRQLGRARDWDAVWWQRRLPQPFESARLRSVVSKLIVDLDDAVWRRPMPPHDAWWRRVRARALLSRADVITVGATSLAKELETDFEGLPTVVRLATPCCGDDLRATAASSSPLLAWVGQPATWRYALAARREWEAVARAVPAARWRVVGAPPEAETAFRDGPLAGRIERVSWSEASESAALAEAWVGLAPLPDDPWTRGKCAARLQACMARGMAVWADRVGAQSELLDRYAAAGAASFALGSVTEVIDWLSEPAKAVRRSPAVAASIAAERSPDHVAAAWIGLAFPVGAVAGRGGTG